MEVDKDDRWKPGGKYAEVGEVLINVKVNKKVDIKEPTYHGMMAECCGLRETRWKCD